MNISSVLIPKSSPNVILNVVSPFAKVLSAIKEGDDSIRIYYISQASNPSEPSEHIDVRIIHGGDCFNMDSVMGLYEFINTVVIEDVSYHVFARKLFGVHLNLT